MKINKSLLMTLLLTLSMTSSSCYSKPVVSNIPANNINIIKEDSISNLYEKRHVINFYVSDFIASTLDDRADFCVDYSFKVDNKFSIGTTGGYASYDMKFKIDGYKVLGYEFFQGSSRTDIKKYKIGVNLNYAIYKNILDDNSLILSIYLGGAFYDINNDNSGSHKKINDFEKSVSIVHQNVIDNKFIIRKGIGIKDGNKKLQRHFWGVDSSRFYVLTFVSVGFVY